MSTHAHAYVVILAGGGGTRLWPKSRNKTPKQFLKLYTNNTLLQDTYERARRFADPDHIIVVSNKDYLDDVRSMLPELSEENIIGEPEKRETAPAMLLGAMLAYARDPEAVIVNLASDHIATDPKEFEHVIDTAIAIAAEKENIVTVGITPTFPHTGLGYIQISEQLRTVDDLPIFKVASFREKPDEQTAKEFLATGKYYWNACNYVWSAETLLEAFATYSPAILETMRPIMDAIGTDQFATVLKDAYKNVEKIAIDYAISEKATNLVLVPGDFGWNDIGDWGVVYDLQQKNDDGNVLLCETDNGKVVCHDSKNNLVHTTDRMIALVGMENTIVVDTGEILMVMPREKSQDVKKIVESIKQQYPEYL